MLQNQERRKDTTNLWRLGSVALVRILEDDISAKAEVPNRSMFIARICQRHVSRLDCCRDMERHFRFAEPSQAMIGQ